MSDFETVRQYGRELEEIFKLRFSPVAIKFFTPQEKAPESAISPTRDLGCHMAMCQAIAYAKRKRKAIVMRREDHWCWNPLIVYGLVECEKGTEVYETAVTHIGIKERDVAERHFDAMPRLPYGKYDKLVCAPLSEAEFEPDVVLLYCNPAQLRAMIVAGKAEQRSVLPSSFDAFDSCDYSIVCPMLDGRYRITVPDPGEYERGLCDESEMIFSIPRDKLAPFIQSAKDVKAMSLGYEQMQMNMEFDFPRPPFYNTLFKLWGLEQGTDWDK